MFDWSALFMLTVVYKLLVNARVLPADFNALHLKSVWFRCQALFIRFLEAAMKQTDSVRSVVLLSAKHRYIWQFR